MVDKIPYPDVGGAAFPTQTEHLYVHGMSLRDYFAGQVVAGLCANPSFVNRSPEPTDPEFDEMLAREAYSTADAMIEDRK